MPKATQPSRTPSGTEEGEPRDWLAPTSAGDEIRRFDALIHEENYSDAAGEYDAVVSAVRDAMGAEFMHRLEGAVGLYVSGAVDRVLDRLVIGRVDEEGVSVWDLRLTHRTDYVPEFIPPPTAGEAQLAVYLEEHPEHASFLRPATAQS
jgi:hypothetical protein